MMNQKLRTIKDNENPIAPSLLSLPFDSVESSLCALNGKVDRLHMDIMDGHFVPNLGLSPSFVSRVIDLLPLPLDIHLMCKNPLFFVELFAKQLEKCSKMQKTQGQHRIIIHIEAISFLDDIIKCIQSYGYWAGISIKPSTPIEALQNIPENVDILFMTVEPGFGGQAFLPEVLTNIQNFRKTNSNFIMTDGGMNTLTIPQAKAAGVNGFVVGSFLFNQSSLDTTLKQLMDSIKEG